MKVKGRLGLPQDFQAPDDYSHYDYVTISEMAGEGGIEQVME